MVKSVTSILRLCSYIHMAALRLTGKASVRSACPDNASSRFCAQAHALRHACSL